jgi:hypothetical protein
MLRMYFCGVVLFWALLFASCSCDSDCPDVGDMDFNDPCVGDAICTYSESFGIHADFCSVDCPPGYRSEAYPDYADTVTVQCRNGRWDVINTTGDDCDEPSNCFKDAGGEGVAGGTGGRGRRDAGRLDGSNGSVDHDDSGRDDDSGS